MQIEDLNELLSKRQRDVKRMREQLDSIKRVPERGMTLPQLAALFAGALTDWSDLPGGGSGPVRLHLPAEASAAAQGFEDAVMERAGLPLAPEGVVRHDDPEGLSRARQRRLAR